MHHASDRTASLVGSSMTNSLEWTLYRMAHSFFIEIEQHVLEKTTFYQSYSVQNHCQCGKMDLVSDSKNTYALGLVSFNYEIFLL
jgi:hypothetical protein